MKIFFSVGEPSGDLHGANLIRTLRQRSPGIQCVGYGGPRMRAAGGELLEDLTQFAVMGFLRVLALLPTFLRLAFRAKRYLRDERPDAVVLIDFPGFNWWIARHAKRYGIPVFYYGPPQMWGWAGWRIHKLRRLVDHVLCKLPFEAAWYAERGCKATYVGHPYFDELRARRLDDAFLASLAGDRSRLTILPGSRTQEVRSNLATQLATAELVRQRFPEVEIAIASFKETQAEIARREVAAAGLDIPVFVGRTPELIEAATCCLAVSGSVSLELLYHAKPTVILYRVSRFAFWIQRFFRQVRYITLVNLLTTDELCPRPVGIYDRHDPRDAHVLMPEYIAVEDPSAKLAEHLVEWLVDEPRRHRLVADMRDLVARVGQGGASERAADYLLAHLPPAAIISQAA